MSPVQDNQDVPAPHVPVPLDEVNAALAAPEVSAELVDDLLEALAELDLEVTDESVDITATVRTTDRTGVEMEALTAVSVAALTVVDMVKAVDKAATITDVRVESKSGGRSGDWTR